MSLVLIYAASVIVAFAGWYVCGPIPNVVVRGVTRAVLVAFLCAPGILVGHGVGLAPTVFALAVQPSGFTLGSIGIFALIMLGLTFGIPGLRRQRNGWPPSAREAFIDGYIAKFLLFGLVQALILNAILVADDGLRFQILQYVLFFGGAAVNFLLCFHAARLKDGHPLLIPILFAAPVFFVAAITVNLLWYGGGAAGALTARGRSPVAAWVSSAVLALLAANSFERSYQAVDAPAHVTIGGGVAGNAAMGVLFVVLAAVSWWLLMRMGRRPPLRRPST